jgi:nucleotide-binding universal stress UspA family protein
MKTLLVPVDFTATSDNAVQFATAWCKQYGYKRLILLKSFYDSLFDDIAVAAVSHDVKMEEREAALERLNEMSNRISGEMESGFVVTTAISELPVLRAIIDVVNTEQPELIVVGSDHHSYSSDSFISGNLIGIAKASPVKVLVVPARNKYRALRKALVPLDFNSLANINMLNGLKSNPYWHDLELHILNVDPKERYVRKDAVFQKAEESLHQFLKNFHYQLHFSNERNMLEGIQNFVRKQPVEVIIALPGKHSFLYSLTHKNISEAIYRNAMEPVLILK